MIGLGNNFLTMTPKAKATKAKSNKCNWNAILHSRSHRGQGWLPGGILSWTRQQWGGSREDLRWLVSANVKTCGVKTSGICRGSEEATSFISGKS